MALVSTQHHVTLTQRLTIYSSFTHLFLIVTQPFPLVYIIPLTNNSAITHHLFIFYFTLAAHNAILFLLLEIFAAWHDHFEYATGSVLGAQPDARNGLTCPFPHRPPLSESLAGSGVGRKKPHLYTAVETTGRLSFPRTQENVAKTLDAEVNKILLSCCRRPHLF